MGGQSATRRPAGQSKPRRLSSQDEEGWLDLWPQVRKPGAQLARASGRPGVGGTVHQGGAPGAPRAVFLKLCPPEPAGHHSRHCGSLHGQRQVPLRQVPRGLQNPGSVRLLSAAVITTSRPRQTRPLLPATSGERVARAGTSETPSRAPRVAQAYRRSGSGPEGDGAPATSTSCPSHGRASSLDVDRLSALPAWTQEGPHQRSSVALMGRGPTGHLAWENAFPRQASG